MRTACSPAGFRTFWLTLLPAVAIGAAVGLGARQTTPAPSSPFITRLPTPEEVEAYRRLWTSGTPAETRPSPPTVTPAAPSAPPIATTSRRAPTSLDALYGAYASDQGTRVFERLRTQDDFERYRPDMLSTLTEWKREWSPRQAAFALDLAVAAFAHDWPARHLILAAARNIVTARPDAPGVRPDDDQFEVLFHRSAVALLTIVGGTSEVETYLSAIQPRVALDRTTTGGARLTDARLVLARAMAHEARTLPTLLSAGSRRDSSLRTWIVSPGDDSARRQLRHVSDLLNAAADYPEVRAEASVRRAFALHRLGAHRDALSLLDTVDSSDPRVAYWASLIRGRVLAALDRPQEAAAAFERAATLRPGAQTPAVALGAIMLRLGDRDRALEWAERARQTTEDDDPWREYWTGDSRFLAVWLAELRKARP